jgi:pimeloyl-ACP methyl ester carboxylesterase
MLKAIGSLILLVALAYLALCALVFFQQRSLIYLPQPRALGESRSAQWLQADGVRLQLSVRERPDAPALIYFGGNAEDVSLSLDELAQALPDHALYLLHYRGYGGSEGSPSEAALFADSLALHAHVARRHPRVSVLGRSLGSGVATYLASQRQLQQLVLVTPYDSIASMAKTQFPWLPVDWLLQDRYDSIERAPAIKAPTTLLVAERDEIIPTSSSRRLFDAFERGTAELHLLRGAGHNDIGLHPQYLPLIAQALNTPAPAH